MDRTDYRGIFVIVTTPFTDDFRLDEAALERTLDFCLAAGVHGVVANALASEGFYLSEAERRRDGEVGDPERAAEVFALRLLEMELDAAEAAVDLCTRLLDNPREALVLGETDRVREDPRHRRRQVRRIHEHPAGDVAALGRELAREESIGMFLREIDEDGVRLPEDDVAVDEGGHARRRIELPVGVALLLSAHEIDGLEPVVGSGLLESEQGAAGVR